MKHHVIIVAGGSGTRMNAGTPKQFLLLRDKPILMHAIEAFFRFDPEISIVVGLPSNQLESWKSLCNEYSFTIEHDVTTGGETRFQTVKNCLEKISDDGFVAIHDGVRPLISNRVIKEGFDIAKKSKTAVASMHMRESIRKINDSENKSHALDRREYRLIQTPQVFEVTLIKKVYQEITEKPWMTDDACVAEFAGHPINLYPGDFENIKITTPPDLLIAEALIDRLKSGNK